MWGDGGRDKNKNEMIIITRTMIRKLTSKYYYKSIYIINLDWRITRFDKSSVALYRCLFQNSTHPFEVGVGGWLIDWVNATPNYDWTVCVNAWRKVESYDSLIIIRIRKGNIIFRFYKYLNFVEKKQLILVIEYIISLTRADWWNSRNSAWVKEG